MIVNGLQFGSKAAGLKRLPAPWTPRYETYVLPASSADQSDWSGVVDQILDSFGETPVILRSSAVAETLSDRGSFDSYPLEKPTSESIIAACKSLHEQGTAAGTQMAVVVQALKHPVMRGHLSNERRVSKTRNQWQVEIDYPRGDSFRVNSQRDTAPDITNLLTLRDHDLKRTLGAIGHWAASKFDSRVHIEWVLDHEFVWIVQLDLEDEAPDSGVDPRSKVPASTSEVPSSPVSDFLEQYSKGDFLGFRKLEPLSDFEAVVEGGFPSLYVLRGSNAAAFLSSRNPEQALRETIGDRLVGRCDILPHVRKGFDGLNLPRTDTVSPAEIIAFIHDALAVLESKDVLNESVVLIFHAFIPAVAAAWAEAAPDEAIVQVDALWGLPDGLQYLDCDVFEYDLSAGALSAEHIPYKNAFLSETNDGTWAVELVRRDMARTASLSREDVGIIARATSALAQKVGHRLRVMWFVNIQGRPKLSRSIPWFCHRPDETAVQPTETTEESQRNDRSEMRRLPAKDVTGPHDLEKVLAQPHRLRLMPTTDHMRNNSFLKDVAAYVKKGKHTVELRGSGLAHAYYLLQKEGVPIVVPSQRAHLRTRRLQTFGKLVRDAIPDKIKANHEQLATIKVPPEDRQRVLISKLMEEAQEVVESTNRDDLRSELADVLEVVRSLIRNAGFDISEIEGVADAKAARLGSFDNGIILLKTHASTPRNARSPRRSSLSTRPVRIGNMITIPHLALVGDAAELTIAGRDLRVSFTTEGVVVEELGPESDAGQLRLDFPSD